MAAQRTPEPVELPVVLTIAGSDSGGGAGIQADLKTIEASGGFGTSAVTAVTAQNTTGVKSSHVLPTEEIDAQIDAVRSDFDVRAVKTGMLATAEIVERVAETAADLAAPVVVDPVMIAATGDRLLSATAESAYETLIAEAALVTPNVDEAAVLTEIEPEDEESSRRAGDRLLEMGADAALIKGGHVPGETVRDVLITPETVETIEHPRIDTAATHGSGCTLSAAIATRLAHGEPISNAVDRSVEFMQRAIRYHHGCGSGPGAVHHLAGIRNEAARWPTASGLESAIERLCASNLDSLVSDTDARLAVSTPYADGVDDVAVFDGGFDLTADSVVPNGSVRFGVQTALSDLLLDVRETRPDVRAAFEWYPDEDPMDRLLATGGEPSALLVRRRDEATTVLAPTLETLLDELLAEESRR